MVRWRLAALAGFFAWFLPSPALADAQLPVTLHVVNYAQVPARELVHAKEHVRRVFARIDVEIAWYDVATPPAAERDLMTILLLPAPMAARKAAADGVSGRVLASAAPAAGRTWAYYDRIADAARAAHLDPAIALGRVLVHELGHLLAPMLPHAERGAMEAALTTERSWVQRFTAPQAQAIRSALGGVGGPPGGGAPLARAR